MEAQNIKADKDGIALTPIFYQPKGKATIGIIEVTKNDGHLVFRGLLTVSGKTGAADVDQRTKPVHAELDLPKKGSKS
jgi:hypothetical protein